MGRATPPFPGWWKHNGGVDAPEKWLNSCHMSPGEARFLLRFFRSTETPFTHAKKRSVGNSARPLPFSVGLEFVLVVGADVWRKGWVAVGVSDGDVVISFSTARSCTRVACSSSRRTGSHLTSTQSLGWS